MSNTAAASLCPKCGTSNRTVARYCVSCGTPLGAQVPGPTTPLPTPSVPSYSAPSPFNQFANAYYATEQARGIDRTKTGLQVMAVGFFLSWVPYIGLIGVLFEFIGAILVILGRKAMGPAHARNVIWSIIICAVAVVAVFVTGVIIGIFAAANYQGSGSPPPELSSFTGLLEYGIIAGLAVFGVAEVLLTYALQVKSGRVLLWVGYAASVSTSIISYLLFNGVPYASALLQLAPSLLFGFAYYRARNRIVNREIPSSPQLNQFGIPSLGG